MDRKTATQIVLDAVESILGESITYIDLDKTLADIGFTTDYELHSFRVEVYQRVDQEGYQISLHEIPARAHDTLLNVVSALPGRPTKQSIP